MTNSLCRAFTWLALLLFLMTLITPIGAVGQEHVATVHAAPDISRFTIGLSGQGRPIEAVRIGDGPRKLVVVGNTHGGPEANTHQLMLELIDHFSASPELVPPEVRLYLIPTLNPDGLALATRFDAVGVDLNRNMNTNLDACAENDWSPTVFGARGIVSETGGPYPDSQVESRLIRGFLLDASGAIFVHSNAGLVFPAFCDHPPSLLMGRLYAGAAGYLYNRFWPNYLITGGMADWAASLGIASITPELESAVASEFAQNLAGLQAVLAEAEQTLPLPEDRVENGVVVPAVIWRYWRSHGGAALFGLPLGPARPTRTGMAQSFTNLRLEWRFDQADTPYPVQPALTGSDAASAHFPAGGGPFAPADPAGAPVFFAQTGHSLREAFLYHWERYGGAPVFGYPISEEFTTTTADGRQRIVQYFERALFAYYPEDGGVRLEPLGAWELQLQAARAPWSAFQVR